MTSRKRDYCFTINNYTDADILQLHELENNPKVRYVIIGRETGSEGTPHIQGYVYFNNAVPMVTVSKLISRAHITPCRGSPQQNIDYCSKDGDFVETGERPVSQKRKGELGYDYWETQKRLAIEGKLDQIDPKLYVCHYSTLKRIAADHAAMPLDNEDILNDWFYGETGTGKSKKARDENPGLYLKMCNKWWDGYNGEDVALLEDFDKNHKVLGHHMKIWADRYAFPAEVKGSKVNLRPKKIIVTSNWSPQQIWGDEPETLGPILRRFKVTHFHQNLLQPSP